MNSLNSKHRKLSTKALILIIVAGALVVFASLTAWQYLAWQRFTSVNHETYQSVASFAKEQVDSIKQLEDITVLHDKLDAAASEMCKASLMVDVRRRVSASAQDYMAECAAQQTRLSDAARLAEDIQRRLAQEQKGSDELTSLSAELKKLKDGDHAAAIKLWRRTAEALDAMEVEDGYRPIHDSLRKAVKNILTKYEALQKADASKSRTAFDDAAVELRDAHGLLEKVRDQAQAQYRELASELTRATHDL